MKIKHNEIGLNLQKLYRKYANFNHYVPMFEHFQY